MEELRGQPRRNMEDSAEEDGNCGSPAEEVSERKNISEGPRG